MRIQSLEAEFMEVAIMVIARYFSYSLHSSYFDNEYEVAQNGFLICKFNAKNNEEAIKMFYSAWRCNYA